ncbi:hypothetical protein [Aquibacillus rhizosphaerae]|uniref:Fur-regulated basic protein FbpA n=1 Tax=Aquibacillus rhizosphaerae TaxID=3051431 RepID=A0ABT7L594_9BACI|nr:hypothetical protein [Aquibacillus sp. LR5S19]MDL4841033.1 hypothetical protein [Aquibacillus sp. LR5S19]
MAYLKKAVDQQKTILINQLIQAGIVSDTNKEIYANKTISELTEECQSIIVKEDNIVI